MKIAPNVGLADKEMQINTKKKRPHQGVYLYILVSVLSNS